MRTNVLWPAGALALAGEAAVHVQQYFALFHEVRWIGPLFIANAMACAILIAGLARRGTRDLAALAGVGISAVALASLIVSYGQGLFGWQEAGFRPIVELTVIFELAAVVLLSAALAAVKHRPLEPSLLRGQPIPSERCARDPDHMGVREARGRANVDAADQFDCEAGGLDRAQRVSRAVAAANESRPDPPTVEVLLDTRLAGTVGAHMFHEAQLGTRLEHPSQLS
jgi:hypothetical protein